MPGEERREVGGAELDVADELPRPLRIGEVDGEAVGHDLPPEERRGSVQDEEVDVVDGERSDEPRSDPDPSLRPLGHGRVGPVVEENGDVDVGLAMGSPLGVAAEEVSRDDSGRGGGLESQLQPPPHL